MRAVLWLLPFAVACTVAACGDGPAGETDTAIRARTQPAARPGPAAPTQEGKVVVDRLERSEEEWRRILTPEQYRILRGKGTEAPGTGALLHNKAVGTYGCAGCGLPLFESDGKFDSGCGWPSFFKPLEGAHITETRDLSGGMERIEITCSRCGGHLGHVFPDGPQPTGLRYCVNSVSIEFEKNADGDR